MPLTLGIDTSSWSTELTLVRDGHELGTSAHYGRDTAERLTAEIHQLLSSHNLDVSTLEAVAVCIGPGSFSGIRAGVAAAQGLALALDVSLVGVGSLYARLSAQVDRPGSYVAALEANKQEYFVQQFDVTSREAALTFEATEPCAAIPTETLEDWAKTRGILYQVNSTQLEESPAGAVALLGERAATLEEGWWQMEDSKPIRSEIGRFKPLYVKRAHAKTIAERAQERSH